ncbi:uncharacterized protein LOC127798545 isoform X2 [Diospyros lotus]|uniref:uncharacterized protein LOC127798545 isoform X2 n=1 Tax=Diospyros lotus TaxID=55363 RepID=UPI00225A9F20|nr:uncharacterized protein LOC127798545 isoform X2 [Diospyros lotus]
MQHVQALPICSERIGGNHLNPRRSPFIRTPSPGVPIIRPRFPFSPSPRITNSSTSTSSSSSSSASSRNAFFSGRDGNNNDASSGDVDDDDDCHDDLSGAGVIDIEIEKTGSNSRRIRSRIDIDASLQTVWAILTSYESLADFIPGLAVSKLLEKRPNFARLLQIGQQKLAFGLNFNAKGIVDCYERELEYLPFGRRRDIEFQMIEGDFKLFQGKWSIEQRLSGAVQRRKI